MITSLLYKPATNGIQFWKLNTQALLGIIYSNTATNVIVRAHPRYKSHNWEAMRFYYGMIHAVM
jgi:hypothetical protein